MAVDDNGNTFSLSPDPMLDVVCPYVSDCRLGMDCEEHIRKLTLLLEKEEIFGLNLCQAGMADMVCDYFREMIAGPGAVQKTLEKYI